MIVRGTAAFLVLLAGTVVGYAYPSNEAVNVQRQGNVFPQGYTSVDGYATAGNLRTIHAGIFGLEYDTLAPGTSYTPFQAICIDASEFLFSSASQLYYVQSLDSFPTFGAVNANSTPSLTAERKRLLEQLFTVAWADAQTSSVKSAAFQWAAWEIGRETQGGSSAGSTLGLTTGAGDIRITAGAGVSAQANTYLSSITAATARASLMIWSPVQQLSDGSFQRVAGQELLTLTPVPEPAHYALLLTAGLAYLISKKRRTA